MDSTDGTDKSHDDPPQMDVVFPAAGVTPTMPEQETSRMDIVWPDESQQQQIAALVDDLDGDR